MRCLLRAQVVVLLGCTVAGAGAQVPQVPGGGAPVTGMERPSTVLEPAVTQLQAAISGVRLEKWKMPGEMRDAADADLRSLERDFKETLPPLLATADGEPQSVTKVLPVLRNVDAAYDVALRVSAMGRLAAPKEQATALEQALVSLSGARHQLGDQVESAAVAQEARVRQLQADVQARQQAAAAATAALPPPPTKAVVKKKPRPKAKVPTAPPAAQP